MWNQKFGCLQHAVHTPVPLHNSQSAMALLHGYPLGLFDHRSGPARYVTNKRSAARLSGTLLENGLRVRAVFTDGSKQNKKWMYSNVFCFFLFSSMETNEGRAVKNYAVHQSMRIPVALHSNQSAMILLHTRRSPFLIKLTPRPGKCPKVDR